LSGHFHRDGAVYVIGASLGGHTSKGRVEPAAIFKGITGRRPAPAWQGGIFFEKLMPVN
jgi:hypothetical protein